MKAQAKRILGREAVVRTNRVVGSFQFDAAGTLSIRLVLPPRSMILSRSDKSGVVVMVNKFWVQVAVDGSTLVPVGRSVSARWQGQPACGAMWSALPIWLPNFASTIRAGSAIWTDTHCWKCYRMETICIQVKPGGWNLEVNFLALVCVGKYHFLDSIYGSTTSCNNT